MPFDSVEARYNGCLKFYSTVLRQTTPWQETSRTMFD